jgi:release factor glutamine methyltransferase
LRTAFEKVFEIFVVPENEMKSGQLEDQPGTIGGALDRAVAELRAAGVESARLVAEVLLAHVLGWGRARLLGHARDSLAAGVRAEFQMLVHRGACGEPLQYLTGEREFYGLPFLVTPEVLIPRPETEFLVEKAVELAGRRADGVRFVDVGTGSGCIAVSVAHRLPAARGWATDISPGALAVARGNARHNGVAGRLGFVCADLMECFPALPIFDFILSNPPYIPDSEMACLPRIVREFEPHLALCGGQAGLEFYRRLIPQAALRLAAPGWLLMEIGAGQARAVENLVAQAGLTLTGTILDLQSIPRCLVARRNR